MGHEIVKVNRVEWLDILKCLGMFLVICGHVTADIDSESIRYYIY